MEAISIKVPEHLLKASGECAKALRLSRAAYIRRAIARMNRDTQAEFRAQRLADVSRRVREESMRVNAEFSAIEHASDPE